MNTLGYYGKATQRALVSTLLMIALVPANATIIPANSPLIVTPSVAPNLILTLDNSGSMRLAYAPDSIGNTNLTRRAKSSTFNPMYYDPNVTYKIPVKVAANGSDDTTPYNTSFSVAPNNGFLNNATTGTINLESAYKVSWDSAWEVGFPTNYASASSGTGASISSRFLAENPAPEFYFAPPVITNTQTGTSTSTPYTTTGITYTITRTTNGNGCTVQIAASTPLAPGVIASCARSGNNYTITSTNQKKAAVPAYYYAYDPAQPSCPATPSTANDNCYKLVIVSSSSGKIRADDPANPTTRDERLNFARWYSFYRTRALATISAAHLAFDTLDQNVRLTWQNLGGCTVLNTSSTACKANYLRKFSYYHRGTFYSWLTSFKFDQYTPLRAAVQRAGESITSDNFWEPSPHALTSTGASGTSTTTPKYACRANYHILMTDGKWNEETASFPTPTTTFVHDGANNTLPDGTAYSQQRPFVDSTIQTLSDLAFHYWASDAVALTNIVKAYIPVKNTVAATQYWDPRNDPATWQHLNTFTIGLGLTESLQQPGLEWTGDTFGGTGYTNLVSGANAWPAASDDSANNVYELWHAAINSRGKFFSADSPTTIITAFDEILNRINGGVTSAAAPGVTASIVGEQITRDVYETRFDPEDWSGDLFKFNFSTTGVRTKQWAARTRIATQTASSRNIKMYDATSTSKLKDFTWLNLSTAQKNLLNINNDATSTPNTDAYGERRLDYIRGDQTREGTAVGSFRERSSVLGDIINSAPVIVAAPKYVSYLADRIEGLSATDASSYSAFKTANQSRTPIVYVGANDGMLHGFDATSGNTTSGNEVFAYIPTAALANLYLLPAQNYPHRFFVDGTPVVNDVYYDSAWHTVLVGTMRAGGRSIFALDITDPAAIKLLWEKGFGDTGLDNLGYTFPQPVIARLHTGGWAVVTGNGYGNPNSGSAGAASLMIFNIQTGDLIKEIVANTAADNGLSSVKLADNNSDGIADYAYAGDLKGNLWRFDLVTTSATPLSPDPFLKSEIGTISANSLVTSFAGSPLYSATGTDAGASPQPITAPPTLVRHPSGDGYLAIFGTGKYFETADGTAITTHPSTLYGVWDKKTKGQTTTAPSPALTRTNLQEQTITSQPTNNFASNLAVTGIRILSQTPVDWATKSGWLLNLRVGTTNEGEMLINPMAIRGQTLLLNTLTPNTDPCVEGVGSWQYGIDPYTGGRTKFNVFDLDNSKTINSADSVTIGSTLTVVSSYKKNGSGGFTTNNGEIFTSPDGAGMKYDAGPTSKGRQSWRAIEAP